jgi:zinc/manganese transport system ATP-binding protein
VFYNEEENSKAQVILLDEPFNAIDARTTGDLLRIISAWHAERRTVIAVLHDHDQVRRAFPQTLLLARNVVAWGDTAEVMCEENLQRARAMAEAVDEHAGVCAVSEAEVLALSGALRPAHEHAHSHPHGQAQHPHPAVAKGGLQ